MGLAPERMTTGAPIADYWVQRWRQTNPNPTNYNLSVHGPNAIAELKHHLQRLEKRAERLEECACRAGPLYSGVTPLTVGNGARWAVRRPNPVHNI